MHQHSEGLHDQVNWCFPVFVLGSDAARGFDLYGLFAYTFIQGAQSVPSDFHCGSCVRDGQTESQNTDVLNLEDLESSSTL